MEMKKEGKIIMATKNDERVLQLKQVIDKKKSELKIGRASCRERVSERV